MAFDFTKGKNKTMARAAPKKELQDFEKAKELALTKHFDTQIENYQKKNLTDTKGAQKASNWMRKDLKGNWWVSYRIKSKPIYFNDIVAEENGWIPSDDVVGDLNAIREELASGNWDKEAQEAFNRPSAKQAKAAKDAEAEASE